MKTIIIYHRADFDGIFCREIARHFLPDAELIGWDFGDPVIPVGQPDIPGPQQLYILDLPIDKVLGLERATSHAVYAVAPRIVWIDHHKSSIESHATDIPGYRIDGVAACRLAWAWFSSMPEHATPNFAGRGVEETLPSKQDFIDRKVSEPVAVRLAGEYDIWDKRDPDAELFQHGLRTRDLDASKWGDSSYWSVMLSQKPEAKALVNDLLVSARYLQYAKTQENANIITHYGFTIQFEGLCFLACNHARFNSFLFTAGIKPEHEALLGFKWTGKDWSVSLYHAPGKEHHDLSKIAVRLGGGGHRGACGFVTKSLPFLCV